MSSVISEPVLAFLLRRNKLTDKGRAPFQAKRVIEFIELYRFLNRQPSWHSLPAIADALQFPKLKSGYRQLRRCLLVLSVAGYIELRRRRKGSYYSEARICRGYKPSHV